MQKYISFIVPCYNSQDYMDRCVDSLVRLGEKVEVIIVNDGSKDRTGEIAEEYEKNFPGIVKAVNKENGGHGSGINTGLKLAEGIYFKVVDSDDWLDRDAADKLMDRISGFCEGGEAGRPDLIVCNYTYNHLDEGKQKVMRYKNVFPEEKVCTWDDIGRFNPSQYLLMHSLVYRTDILRKSGIELPEHTFYVDNIFAYQPLPYVESIFYMDIDLYQYYLGREDQSVNEKVMISRIDQQIRVTNIIIGCVDVKSVKERYPRLAAYLYRYISMMMIVSSIHLLLSGSPENIERHKEIWRKLKENHPGLYHKLRYTELSGFMDIPGPLGRKVAIGGYRIAKKIYKFQ